MERLYVLNESVKVLAAVIFQCIVVTASNAPNAVVGQCHRSDTAVAVDPEFHNNHAIMASVTLYLCLAVIPLVVYYYISMKKKFRYWADRNVAHKKPLPPFGTILPEIVGLISGNEASLKLYREFPNEKLVGTYGFTIPGLLIRDTALIEKILVKDFQYFADRTAPPGSGNQILNLGLFSLTGNTWRSIRNRITPTFTTGKLKQMFDRMLPCADILVESFSKHKSDSCNIKDELVSYSIDIMSNVIFGVDIKKGPLREEFGKRVASVFQLPLYKIPLFITAFFFPKFGKFFNLKLMDMETENYFHRLIEETFRQRQLSGLQRNDYVQLLLKLKEQGHLEIRQKYPEDDYLKLNEAEEEVENIEITDELLTAQAFQFILGGFDPLYETMQLFLHELSRNQDIQDKVRDEIKKCLENNGEYTYKALKEMTYLEQCIHETLRLYPIIPNLMRICLKDYTTEDGLTIEKGTNIMISIRGVHMDADHFPNPEKFDPDRFHPNSTVKRFSYLPFSDGPRMCIGMRYAMIEMKLALSKLIENYKFDVSPKTKIPIKLDERGIFLKAYGIYFDVKKVCSNGSK